MAAQSSPVLVRACRSRQEFERRTAERHECWLDATTHALDAQDTLAWGATIRDVSRTGVGLTICFPFREGTYLAVELHSRNPNQASQTYLTRVAQVRDRNDGTWHVGCEFVKALSDEEIEQLI